MRRGDPAGHRGRNAPRPIVLVVLDGFGIGPDPAVDAIRAADMPVWRGLLGRWPNAVLRASEDAVGLPPGQMGNSEVGHLNLGAGKPVLQDLPRIDAAIADGSFNERPALLEACRRAAGDDGRLHIISLIGPGGVHANDRHLVALVGLAGREGVRHVRIHALLDGRDTPPSSALGFVADLERRLAATHPDARIASVGGRYWAMDRDTRWERTERGYDAIVHGEGRHAQSAVAAIEEAYARGETDEFVAPTVIDGVDGLVRDGDPIVHANFRADRARQLTRALALRDFDAFDRVAERPPGAGGHVRRDDDRLRGRAAGRGGVPARGCPVARTGRSPKRAGRSSTSPRPRSTRTSRTSSTAGSRRPTRERNGCSSRVPGSPPTTSSRR